MFAKFSYWMFWLLTAVLKKIIGKVNYQKMINALTIGDIINFSSYNDSPSHIIFR